MALADELWAQGDPVFQQWWGELVANLGPAAAYQAVDAVAAQNAQTPALVPVADTPASNADPFARQLVQGESESGQTPYYGDANVGTIQFPGNERFMPGQANIAVDRNAPGEQAKAFAVLQGRDGQTWSVPYDHKTGAFDYANAFPQVERLSGGFGDLAKFGLLSAGAYGLGMGAESLFGGADLLPGAAAEDFAFGQAATGSGAVPIPGLPNDMSFSGMEGLGNEFANLTPPPYIPPPGSFNELMTTPPPGGGPGVVPDVLPPPIPTPPPPVPTIPPAPTPPPPTPTPPPPPPEDPTKWLNPWTLGGAGLGLLDALSQPKTMTTVQDIPDWQKPYVTDLFNRARTTLDQTQGSFNPAVNNAARDVMYNTIAGNFMSPGSNPWLKANLDLGAGRIGESVNSLFSGAGRYGSGAHQGVLGQKVGDFANQFLFNNYNTERGRQMTAATAAPGFTNEFTTSPFAPLNAYGNIVGQKFGQQTTAPNYSSPLGGAAAGALSGALFSKMFGGK